MLEFYNSYKCLNCLSPEDFRYLGLITDSVKWTLQKADLIYPLAPFYGSNKSLKITGFVILAFITITAVRAF